MKNKDEIYIINMVALTDCLRAASHEEVRPHLTGVFIHDDENANRHYVATDGHILIHFSQPRCCTPLQSGVIIKPCGKLPLKARKEDNTDGILRFIDDDTALLKDSFGKYLCDIVDGSFPEYEQVIPPKHTPELDKYVGFNPDYLKIAKTVYGGAYLPRPRAVDEVSPCLWTTAAANCEVEIVLMPMRL